MKDTKKLEILQKAKEALNRVDKGMLWNSVNPDFKSLIKMAERGNLPIEIKDEDNYYLLRQHLIETNRFDLMTKLNDFLSENKIDEIVSSKFDHEKNLLLASLYANDQIDLNSVIEQGVGLNQPDLILTEYMLTQLDDKGIIDRDLALILDKKVKASDSLAIEFIISNVKNGLISPTYVESYQQIFKEAAAKDAQLADKIFALVKDKKLPTTILDNLHLAKTKKIATKEGWIANSDLMNAISNFISKNEYTEKFIAGQIVNLDSSERKKFIDKIFNSLPSDRASNLLLNLISSGIIDEERVFDIYKHKDMELHFTSFIKHISQPEKLLDLVDKNGKSILEIAALNGNARAFELIVEKLTELKPEYNQKLLRAITVSNVDVSASKMLEVLKFKYDFAKVETREELRENILLAYASGNTKVAEKLLKDSKPESKDEGLKKEFAKFKHGIIAEAFVHAAKAENANVLIHLIKKHNSTSNTIKSGVDGYLSPMILIGGIKDQEKRLKVLEEFARFFPTKLKDIDSNGNNILQHAINHKAYSLAEFLISDEERARNMLNFEHQRGYGTAINIAYAELNKNLEALTKNKDNPNELAKIQADIVQQLEFIKKALDVEGIDISKVVANKSNNFGRSNNMLIDAYRKVLDFAEANPTLFDSKENSFLKTYLEGLKDITTLMLVNSKNAATEVQDEYGRTILSMAAAAGDLKVVQLLTEIKGGKNSIEIADENGNTPIFHAANSGRKAVVDELISKGADLKKLNANGANVLMLACSGGALDVVKTLNSKFDINAKDEFGRNALHYAVRSGAFEFAKLLKDKSGIEQSVKAQKTMVIEHLLANKADINAADSEGRTPLMDAIIQGDFETVKLLRKNGASINVRDSYGNTPLILASLVNNSDIVSYLIDDVEANLNARNKDGLSALNIASARFGIEGMPLDTEDAKKYFESEKDALDAAKQMKGALGLDNESTKKIVEQLVGAGADPYVKGEEASLLRKVVRTVLVTSIAGGANQLLAMASPEAAKIGQNIIAAGAGYQVYKDVKGTLSNWVRTSLKSNSVFDSKISNTNMFGSFHVGRFGTIISGEALQKDMKSKLESGQKYVFTIKDFQELPLDAQQKNRKVLQNRYSNLRNELDNKFQPFWAKRQLSRLANELLEAEANIFETGAGASRKVGKNTFENDFSEILKLLETPSSRETIIRAMLKNPNDEKLKFIKDIVDSLNDNKVYGSLKSHHDAKLFAAEFNKIKLEPEPGLFKRLGLSITGRSASAGLAKVVKIKIDDDKFKQHVAKGEEIKNNSSDVSEVNVAKSKPKALSPAVKLVSWWYGVDPKIAIEKAANSWQINWLSMGIGAGVGAMLATPEVKDKATIGVGVASAAMGAANVALMLPWYPILVGAAAAGGAYGLWSQKDKAISMLSDFWEKNFPKGVKKPENLQEALEFGADPEMLLQFIEQKMRVGAANYGYSEKTFEAEQAIGVGKKAEETVAVSLATRANLHVAQVRGLSAIDGQIKTPAEEREAARSSIVE